MTEHDYELLEAWVEFYEDYYKEEIAEIAQKPNDKQSLWIDQSDLFRYNPGLLDDLRKKPDAVLSNAEEAVDMVDVPLDVDLTHITVRVRGLPEEHILAPGEVRKEHGGQFVGVRGNLERVTTSDDLPRQLVFECDRCGSLQANPPEIRVATTGELGGTTVITEMETSRNRPLEQLAPYAMQPSGTVSNHTVNIAHGDLCENCAQEFREFWGESE